tara:strand:+ start:1214 stop:1873 length:660 start_codon:yes stop_codon:yes gene_type:complete
MTSNEMIDLLALRLEDPEHKTFTKDSKFKALNVAQLTITNLITNELLTELEHSEDITLDANGTKAITSLTKEPIRNGIYAIYNQNTSVKAYINLINFKDIKRLENSYLKADYTNPVGYIFANKIHSQPKNADTVTVYYLRKPTDIASGVDSELDVSLHECVVDLAESQLWKMDSQYERANQAQVNAMGTIDSLNMRLANEKPQGLGTYGRVSSTPPAGV